MAEWHIKTAKATFTCSFTPPLVASQWSPGQIGTRLLEFRWEPSLHCFFLRSPGSKLEQSLHIRTLEVCDAAASLEADVNISMTGKPSAAITAELRPAGFSTAGQALSRGPRLIAVKAPLTGKILKIQKNQGEVVQKGEVLAIIEAMKMENSLLAPQTGKISAVNGQVGETVQVATTLFSIEALA